LFRDKVEGIIQVSGFDLIYIGMGGVEPATGAKINWAVDRMMTCT
jgi:hypothetical protein